MTGPHPSALVEAGYRHPDNTGWRFAGALEPSDGVEPSTPSLPFRFRGRKRGHERVPGAPKAPQTERVERRDVTRAWTRVVGLMFAPRSHEAQRDVARIGEGIRPARPIERCSAADASISAFAGFSRHDAPPVEPRFPLERRTPARDMPTLGGGSRPVAWCRSVPDGAE